MQPHDALTNLFSHNLWANLRLLKRCAELTDEQLAASIPGSRGSIRGTLEHIALSEQGYLSRISTGQRLRRPDDAPPLTIAEMMESLRASGQNLIEWASRVK